MTKTEILNSLKKLPFPLGINNFISYLIGEKNKSIEKNQLYLNEDFGILTEYQKNELKEQIETLRINGFIELTPIQNNPFIKVLSITSLGEIELKKPETETKKFYYEEQETKITEKHKKLFEALGDYLNYYNDEQKLAIIESSKNILCIAGAGTGKTSVLTKRIEFLIKYKSTNPKQILAITFTRKAKEEMIKRLQKMNITEVQIETFNSFAEKILKKHEETIYGKKIQVISYSDKIKLINQAIINLNKNKYSILETYFDKKQKRGKTNEELFKIFVSDCFFVIDYYKYKNLDLHESNFYIDQEHIKATNLVYNVCKYVTLQMKKKGLRDFTDQIIDTIQFFKEHPDKKPKYEHILIDEYQDINSAQIELIDLLKTPNLFVVGDPRQSIYGWRGSDIKYILNFQNRYEDVKTITLTKNYRSTMFILDLINKQIRFMGLKNLEHDKIGNNTIFTQKFQDTDKEYEFVVKKILKLLPTTENIFVISRTNYELKEFETHLQKFGIFYGKKTEFEDTSKEHKITLATIHAIKGLEAQAVFVIGCNTQHFPCITSEHPIISLMKINEYDKEEEEKRLLYVALSRAKEYLYITHTGKLTNYLNFENKKEQTQKLAQTLFKKNENKLLTALHEWRNTKAKNLGIPAYLILNNATLEEISLIKPVSNTELNEIKGLGPVKTKRFGKEIITIIQTYK